MALLVLGDLRVDVVGFRADDDRDDFEARPFRGAQSLRAEKNAVAAVIRSPTHDDGLKDAAQRDVLGELGNLLIRELGPRVAGIFLEAVDGNEEWKAFGSESVERECRRGGARLRVDDLIGSFRDEAFDRLCARRVDEIELLYLRLGPGHAHERIVPLRFASW